MTQEFLVLDYCRYCGRANWDTLGELIEHMVNECVPEFLM